MSDPSIATAPAPPRASGHLDHLRGNDPSIPTHYLVLDGPPGSGKTTLLSAFLLHLASGPIAGEFQLENPLSHPALDQLRRILSGSGSVPTEATDGADLNDLTGKEAAATFRMGPNGLPVYRLVPVAQAGEEHSVALLAQTVKNIPDLAARFNRDQPRILCVLLNASLASPEVAKLGFKAHVARLCAIYAEEEATRERRGKELTPVPDLPPGKASLARTAIETTASCYGALDVHTVHPSVEGLFLNLPADARVVYDRAERRFRVVSADLTPAEEAKIINGMDRVATTLAAQYAGSLPIVTALAGRADRAIIVLSRYDIVHWLGEEHLRPEYVRAQCLKPFQRIFHSVVEADFMSIEFERDWRGVAGGRPSWWPNVEAILEKTRSLSELIKAVDAVVARDAATVVTAARAARVEPESKTELPPPKPQPTFVSNEHGPIDRVAVASYRVVCEAPFILAAAIVLAGVANGWAWPLLWRWMAFAGCVLVARWLWLLLPARLGSPAWIVQGARGEPDQGVLIDTETPPFQASPGAMSIRTSPVSSLFGIGWVWNQGRPVLVPRVRQFVTLTGAQVEADAFGGIVAVGQLATLAGAFLLAVVSLIRS